MKDRDKFIDKFSFVKTERTKSIIFSGIILILFYIIASQCGKFFDGAFAFLKIFRPIIVGGFIAMLLNRPMNALCIVYKKIGQKIKFKRRQRRNINSRNNNQNNSQPQTEHESRLPAILALITSYLIAIAVVASIILIIVPEFTGSIKLFSENFSAYYNNFENFLKKNFNNLDLSFLDNFGFNDKVSDFSISDVTKYIPNILQATFGLTSSILDYTLGFVGAIIDVVIGIVFSIYILADKEHLKRQANAFSRAMLPDKPYTATVKYTKLTTNTFINFFSGQLAEAVILGVLCFIGMSIIGFEYPLMISAIIGITNLIPIVGPIIGTIPGAIILLLVNPYHMIWFVVFVIILQQLESNLIYPRVVGNSVGLPPLWVLFSITVGGGLGGIFGMFVAVPVMSIIHTIVSDIVRNRLEKKNIQC